MIVKQMSDISPTDFKIGDTVNYLNWGKIQSDKIIGLSRDKKIMFFSGSRFAFVDAIVNGN